MLADFDFQIAQGWVHVGSADNELIGYVVFYRRDDHLHLENIAVLPERSGCGYGRQLIDYVEQQAKRQNLNAVELYTNVGFIAPTPAAKHPFILRIR